MAGVKTFTEMQSILKMNLGQRSDAEDASCLDDWINDAYRDLTSRFEFAQGVPYIFPELDSNFTVNTVDGTATVTRPTTTAGVLNDVLIYTIYNTTEDRKLDYRTYPWYLRQSRTTESEPRYWSVYGLYLYLSPTPDDEYALDINYRRRVTLLTGTAVTEISPEWDEPIIELATVKGLMHLRDYEKVKSVRENLQEMIASKIRIFNAMERDRLHQYYRPDYIYTRGGY
jgi:hypothetical protein